MLHSKSKSAVAMVLMAGILGSITSLSGCSESADSTAAQPVSEPEVIALSADNPTQPTDWFVFDSETALPVVSETTQTADNKIRLDRQSGNLSLSFEDNWLSGIYATSPGLDLRDFLPDGTLSFDLAVEAIDEGTLDVLVDCHLNCRFGYRLREWAQAHQGQGMQHLSIPLNCLVGDNGDVSKVERPFELRTGGKGRITVANIEFHATGDSNLVCPQHLSVTPEILNEYWSTAWWIPRHEQKVDQASLGEARLVMIGDSITHGWENEGAKVWQQHFADINTLNLGFGGDRTENVLWRLQHGELDKVSPALTVVMIGTNNTGHRLDTPEAIHDGVQAILQELKQRIPDSKILLLAIFPRSAQPDDVLRENNRQANELLQQLAGQEGVLFDSFNQAFLDQQGTLSKDIMPDLLHPNETGYGIWAQQLLPYVEQYVRRNENSVATAD